MLGARNRNPDAVGAVIIAASNLGNLDRRETPACRALCSPNVGFAAKTAELLRLREVERWANRRPTHCNKDCSGRTNPVLMALQLDELGGGLGPTVIYLRDTVETPWSRRLTILDFIVRNLGS
jgi:hypothetical protein